VQTHLSSNEFWNELDAALKECGYFARVLKPGDEKYLGTKYWPPPTRSADSPRPDWGARAECRGSAPTTHIMWRVWNEELCKHWMPAWLEAARLIEKLELTKFVAEQALDDEVLRITHRLFVRLLTSEQPSTVEGVVAKELAEERRSLLGPPQDPPDLRRFRLGEYFDIWLWPRVSGQRGRARHSSSADAPELLLLTGQARVFRDILVQQKPDAPMTGPKLCDEYRRRTGESIEEADFRRRVVPQLKQLGMTNKRRVGYYFPTDAQARTDA
jgi:hypothetical protein